MFGNATKPVRITEFREIPYLISAHRCGFDPQYYEGSMKVMTVPEFLLAGVKDPFFISAAGDSMSPKIEDGDSIIVDLTTNIKSGDIITCLLDGTYCVKIFYRNNFSTYLRSFNSDYPDRKLTENDEIEILGKVAVIIKRP